MDKKISIQKEQYSRSWPWKMAWRDSRKSRGKLLLFIASISLGIAAMVGIISFRENLLDEIDNQARELIGADFRISGNRVLPDTLLSQFKSITADHSRESYFSSMILFQKQVEHGSPRYVPWRVIFHTTDRLKPNLKLLLKNFYSVRRQSLMKN